MNKCALLDRCVRETKAGRLGAGATDSIARDLVVIGIECMPDDPHAADTRTLRRAIAKRYKEEYKPGFVFASIILPLMISLVSHWLVKWFFDHPTQLAAMKTGSPMKCICQCPTEGTPSCTSTARETKSTSSK